jgi:hypothetical protein
MRRGDSALIELVHNQNSRIADGMAVRMPLSGVVLEAILGLLQVVCAIG